MSTELPSNRSILFRRFLQELTERLRSGRIPERAADIAYHLLMSAIPLLLLFLQIGSLLLANPEGVLLRFAATLPAATFEWLQRLLDALADAVSPTTLGITLLTALWLGSRGVDALIKNIAESLSTRRPRRTIARRAVAVLYTVALLLLLFSLLLFHVFYGFLSELISNTPWLNAWLGPLWKRAGFFLLRLLPFAGLVLILLLFYKAAPATVEGGVTFREAAVGSVFAALGIFLTTTVYAFIMDHISRLSLYFGSLAGIVFLLVWLLYVCSVIVAGAEVVAAFRATYRRWFQQRKKPRKTKRSRKEHP